MADRGTQQSEVQTGVVEGAEQLVQSALELNKKRQDELKAKLNLLQSRLSKVDDTIVSPVVSSHLLFSLKSRKETGRECGRGRAT